MRKHTAAVVTMDDLTNYFKGSARGWESDIDIDTFVAHSKSRGYELKFKPESTLFHVHVEAVDDSSDSHDETTDDPVKSLASFLGNGLPGGEVFEKMSSVSPKQIEHLLRYVATVVRAQLGNTSQIRALLRRVAVLPSVHTSSRENVDEREILQLKKDMEKKGWRVQPGKSDAGLPSLVVDISGIYEAKISVDSIKYSYEMDIEGGNGTKESGVTNDPIEVYEKWTYNPHVIEARDSNIKKSESGGVENKPSRDDVTVAPNRKPAA